LKYQDVIRQEFSIEQCVAAISRQELFHASVNNGAFIVKIDSYANFVCTAIHNGHRLRPPLLAKCALDNSQRLHEEDPYTANVISNMPITVIANDSRYEYDLNRPPETCVYEEAWGQTVWSKPLTNEEKTQSLAKHSDFYIVLGALYKTLESIHPQLYAYDIHSYNYQRPGMGDVPLFNIGTEQVDTERWQGVVNQWAAGLGSIQLPRVDVRAAINEVFQGRGYQATFVKTHCSNTLLLATELKKVFMDENTGEPYSDILEVLQPQFEQRIFLMAKNL